MVAISDLRTPNAFAATTVGGGIVGVTSGLLEMLSPEEIEAVVAHEVAHLTDPGQIAATIAAVLVSPLGALATVSGSDLFYERPYRKTFIRAWGGKRLRPVRNAVALITIPIAALLVRVSVSPAAEIKADCAAARLTGNPGSLRSALRKIDALAGRVLAPVNPAVAQLLLVHPFGASRLGRLFDAHPSLAARLAALDASSSVK
jgi:heat shock protein HtpX